MPQLVMLCRQWVHLQCFAGRTGRTHGTTVGYCVAGKRTQYRNIRPFQKKFKVSNTLPNSLSRPASQQSVWIAGLQLDPEIKSDCMQLKLSICRIFVDNI